MRPTTASAATKPPPNADNFLTAYFDVQWPAGVVALGLKAQLYLAIVAQALLVKSDITTRRGRNSWGVCVWQLNEIWPTGGWGGLECESPPFSRPPRPGVRAPP